ncbi:MAG: anti-sigma factor [Pyrinomonadaceae bacterium]|nr:anti-sigma factor [Pyrinomonadaceae bacterium]
MTNNMEEKLLDLLCDQAASGLNEDERLQLEKLSAGANSDMDAQSLELAAAAIMMAEMGAIEAMPSHLEASIAAAAGKYFTAKGSESSIHESLHDQPTKAFKWQETRPSRSFFDWFGWAVAAAACVALIGTFIYEQNRIGDLQAKVMQLTPTPVVEETLAQKRDRLKKEAADVTRAEWTKGNVKDSEGVMGEVVWSDEKQEGYMTFRGLPVNDANKEAYQLWIFEDGKLESHPKDGGVFNVSSDGEVVVAIKAKLKTNAPKAFAVTIEKPGGVVVSDRTKIAALAPVKTA